MLIAQLPQPLQISPGRQNHAHVARHRLDDDGRDLLAVFFEGRLGPLFTDPRCFDASRQVPAVMPAGSVVFFSPHAVHGSEPNRSDSARRAFVVTYQPAGHRMFRVDAERRAG